MLVLFMFLLFFYVRCDILRCVITAVTNTMTARDKNESQILPDQKNNKKNSESDVTNNTNSSLRNVPRTLSSLTLLSP